ncbi:hypothetical protein [Primorskyibacter sp. S187A]|uniref:hypothetical protein n=1 Tax=Primorskyibacter sp. S187A TaxID=3415130 RepID=UPI003C7DB926
MEKAGSSSIQNSLAKYDDGVVRYARLGRKNHSVQIQTAVMKNAYRKRFYRHRGVSQREVAALRKDYREMLAKETSLGHEVLIISGEDIPRMGLPAVRNLKNFLEQHCDEVKLLAYVRDPVGYAGSYFQQVVKHGRDELVVPQPHYRAHFERFMDVFGRDAVTLRPFDISQMHEQSIVRDVLHFAGARGPAPEELRINEGLSYTATKLLFIFNRSGCVSQGNAWLMAARRSLVSLLQEKFDGEKFRFPKSLFTGDLVDRDDVAWVDAHSGSNFQAGLPQSGAETTHDLESWTQEFTQVTEEERKALKKLVARRGLGVHDDAATETLLSLLFYAELVRHVPSSAPSELKDVMFADQKIRWGGQKTRNAS